MPGGRRRVEWVWIPVLLLAFLLRVERLAAEGLWYDEAFSVELAQHGWHEIIVGELNLPPLYNLLLGAWGRLAGWGDFQVRYLSVLCGTLVVALGGAMIALLLGRRAGALAALLLAASPIEIWYAREARMYVLLAVLALASTVALARLMCGRTERRWWLLYTLANVAALYTHYYAAFVVAAQAVWVLTHFLRTRDGCFLRGWVLSQLGLGLALLPWVPVFVTQWRAANTTYWPGSLSLTYVATNALLGFMGADRMAPVSLAARLAMATCILAALGLLAATWQPRVRWETGMLAAYVGVPLLIFYVLVHSRPKFSPRYLLVAVPGFLGLAAGALSALWPVAVRRWHEWLRAALAALVVCGLAAGSAYAATTPWRDTRFGREDFKGAAAFLTRAAASDEAVILLSGHSAAAFARYYHRDNCYPLPEGLPPSPSVDDIVTLETLDDLSRAIAGRRGAWLLLWQNEVVDPNGLVLALFDLFATRQPVEARFRGLELRHYVLPEGLQLSREMFVRTPLNVPVGDEELVLVGRDLPARPVPSGETATLLLHWKALRPTAQDYRLSLQVLDEAGQVLAEGGGRVAGWMYPTYRWQPGRLITARQDVRLPAGLPPGDYLLRARIFALGEQAALTIPLGELTVGRALRQPTLAELGISEPMGATLAELELLSCQVSPREAGPGQAVQATLIWRARARPAKPYRVALSLGSRAWATLPLPASARDLQAGDALRMVCSLLVPPDAADGRQAVSLSLMAEGSQPVAGPIAAGEIGVHAGERLFEAPAGIANPLRVDLGGKVAFLGYTLDRQALRPGESFHLDLYWQGVRRMDTSYTVFVHLLDGREKIWGQVDSVPVHSTRPTTGWLPGEVVIDSYDVAVYPDAPPGQYVIEVGLYDAATGERLPAFDESGNHLWADRILLSSVQVLPPASGR
ncbi:MAG: glycosyltransferase family 39 protein [Anaerolineae bacterium]|nr:glycosyltransferase family 39 protein [Anaerolineae bacterium]